MGHESFVYGLIVGSYRNPTDAAHNHAVVAQLPLDDASPFVGRSLFARPGRTTVNDTYRTEVIHFGASYSAVEWEWPIWLAKFEAVLAQLVWHEVWVHLRTDLVGDYTYHYQPEPRGERPWLHDPRDPGPQWRLTGGPRDFCLGTPTPIPPWQATDYWRLAAGIWTLHPQPPLAAQATDSPAP